jgi:4-hydroxybutyrate dehydrogenase
MMFKAVFLAYKKLGADLSYLEGILSNALGCDNGEAWEELFKLIDFILPRQPISELGVDEARCREMAASVVKNQQRLLVNNPIALDEEQIAQIYIDCL